MLLLGKIAGDRKPDQDLLPLLQSEPPQARDVSRLADVKQAVDACWEENSCTAFPLLLTRNKWQVQKRNLQVGDIEHLRYDRQFEDYFCLAMILKLLPDSEGVVRPVVVNLRDNRSGPGGIISASMLDKP